MASALEGWGVIETFRNLAELAYQHIDKRYELKENHGLDKETYVLKLTRRPDEAGNNTVKNSIKT